MTSRVRLTRPDGRRVWRYRLVMEQHLGRELSPSELIHHKNKDYRDDRLENLEVVSRPAHASMHHKGTARPGHPNTKMSRKEVVVVRKLHATGKFTQSQLARKFGVAQATISLIVRNKRRTVL